MELLERDVLVGYVLLLNKVVDKINGLLNRAHTTVNFNIQLNNKPVKMI